MASNDKPGSSFGSAAYGGDNWSPRLTTHRQELGTQWTECGYQVMFPEFHDDQASYRGINFVTLGPRRILMVAGLSSLQDEFEKLGIECLTCPTDELSRAAGNVGCLTSVLWREQQQAADTD
jgi:arginine deiminase